MGTTLVIGICRFISIGRLGIAFAVLLQISLLMHVMLAMLGKNK